MSRWSEPPEEAGAWNGLESMVRLTARWMEIPFRVFFYGMELAVRAVEEVQGPAWGGNGSAPSPPPPVDRPAWPPPAPGPEPPSWGQLPARATETTEAKERPMALDTDLSGEDLKVVEYSILTVKREVKDHDRILYGPKTVAVSDDMEPQDFASWVISLFMQDPKPEAAKARERLDHNGKKYLRVTYTVQARLRKQEGDKTDALWEIKDLLDERLARPKDDRLAQPPSSGGGSSPAERARQAD